MKRFIIIIITFATNCFFLFPQTKKTALLYDLVNNKQAAIQSIKTNALLSLIFCVLIAFLGFTAAIVQNAKKKNVKMATMIIGASITFLTIISGAMLDGDFKQLNKKVKVCESYRDDIIAYLRTSDSCKNETESEFYLNTAQELFAKMNLVLDFNKEQLNPKEDSTLLISEKSKEGSTYNHNNPGFLWAGDVPKIKPNWVEKMPLDDQYIYFIGKGMNLELLRANEMAEQEARNAAINYVWGQKGIIDFNDTLRNNINKIIEVSDTYFEKSPDPTKEMYSCYVLVKIKMDMLSFVLRRDPLDQNRDKAMQIESNIMNQKSIERYSRDRIDTYEFILSAAHGILDEKSYGDFGTARTLRENGDFHGAISILEPILNKYPNFYFGWYNLALSYDNLNEFSNADVAYQKAIRLEPTQKVRDASLYNTYGFFLLRQGKADLAVMQLEECLRLAPGHEIANKNLLAAKKALEKQI
jgi:tetratricopeptide (TPR) repeat protein